MDNDGVVQSSIDAGDLWEVVPGVIGLKGDGLSLFKKIEHAVRAVVAAEAPEEWHVPAAISLGTLARAEYFASFPQWLTLASHLSDEDTVLERVATAPDPAVAVAGAVAPASAALPPAVCYHFYEGLSDSVVRSRRVLTAQATCWRHEGEGTRQLERGWAFTMREIVCIGTSAEVEDFRLRLMTRVGALAARLDLHPQIGSAADPFFAPTARGKALLQSLKSLKHELLLPIGGGKRIAAASFNNHDTFFGERFGIRLGDGAPASTACVAFGLERWLLAALAARPDRAAADRPRHLGETTRRRLLAMTVADSGPNGRSR